MSLTGQAPGDSPRGQQAERCNPTWLTMLVALTTGGCGLSSSAARSMLDVMEAPHVAEPPVKRHFLAIVLVGCGLLIGLGGAAVWHFTHYATAEVGWIVYGPQAAQSQQIRIAAPPYTSWWPAVALFPFIGAAAGAAISTYLNRRAWVLVRLSNAESFEQLFRHPQDGEDGESNDWDLLEMHAKKSLRLPVRKTPAQIPKW